MIRTLVPGLAFTQLATYSMWLLLPTAMHPRVELGKLFNQRNILDD